MQKLSVVVLILGVVLMNTAHLSSVFAQDSCPSGTETLSIGDTFEGLIDDTQTIIQACFTGNEAEVVTIRLSRSSGDLDTYLQLTDLSGNEVFATNDDRSLSSTDSEIVFEIPEDAVYIINASRFNQDDGETDGGFTLTLMAEDSTSKADTERPDGCPILYDVIKYDESIDGEIDNRDYSFFYCFVGTEGDEVVIDATATSGDLDTLLLLTDLRFDEIYAENDDREISTRNSRIVYVLPESGAYLITLTRYDTEDGETEGDFELIVQLNDGTFTDEDLYNVREPNPYECNRPLVRELNAAQWVDENEAYNFRLNFGCEGLAVVSIFGEVFDVPYMFEDDALQLEFNGQVYTVELGQNGQMTLSGEDSEFVFMDAGRCTDELEQDLVEGVWFLGDNDTFFRLDFMCGGVMLLTLESEVDAFLYNFDSDQETLEIQGFNIEVWTDVFILPGSQMSVETNDDPFIFTNVLTEIEDTNDADI